MSEQQQSAPPKWFWAVSGLGLVWNALGVMAFVVQMTMDLTELPADQAAFYAERPLWAVGAFALAVLTGTGGCVGLLLRKDWAIPMLILCVVGIAVQTFHSLALTNSIEVFGTEGLLLALATFVIGALLTWFARYSERQGWIAGAASR